jgi:hypothetical protein
MQAVIRNAHPAALGGLAPEFVEAAALLAAGLEEFLRDEAP